MAGPPAVAGKPRTILTMTSALLIRLRPVGPWRYGPGEGGLDRVDKLYRSDRLFSAVTLAFKRLGLIDDWLDATARASVPAVACSSLFPFQGDTLFVPPPATLWPPPAAALRIASSVFGTKVRWKAAQFVPVTLVETLLMSQRLLSEQWIPDPKSGCLLRRDRPQSSPFRTVSRRQTAVDRLGVGVEPHSVSCVEFEPTAGLWAIAKFANEDAAAKWSPALRSVFALLSDTGFGGRRSSGWGQAGAPEFQQGPWPAILLPKFARAAANANGSSSANGAPPQHWMLSLFSPGPADMVDWSAGSYSVTLRGGRVDSTAGTGREKKLVRMVTEGSVIAAAASPVGSAINVAPDDFPHPVYRSGFAVGLQLPVINFAAVPEEPVPIPEEIPAELIPAVVTEEMIAEDEAAEQKGGEESAAGEHALEAEALEEELIEHAGPVETTPVDDHEGPLASGIGTGREAEDAAAHDPVPPFVGEGAIAESSAEPEIPVASEPETPLKPEAETPAEPKPDDAENEHEI